MLYYSLNKQSPPVDFKQAVLQPQAPDKGLYFPSEIPIHDHSFFYTIDKMTDEEIAWNIIHPYVGGAIPDKILRSIIAETINFSIPLVPIDKEIYSLELYHGPTLAFKDIGARFMSRCLGYFSSISQKKQKTLVLVATSGDTGGAVANGFYGVEGVEVVILYPSGKVSGVQEKQLTTPGKNIHAIAVLGNFDDCQRMVKQAFADKELNEKLFLTSANSINIARWLPQQFYYMLAWKQWPDKSHPPVISVPSGNFGNICAGLLAHASGLPVKHFIAACNANDVVPEFFKTGNYQPKKTIPTISNAMDVGDPSNWIRLMEILKQDPDEIKTFLSAVSVSDDETRETIRQVYSNCNYLMDPHGAVGYRALKHWLGIHPGEKGIVLATAHPIKFYDIIEPVIGAMVPVPKEIENVLNMKSESFRIDSDYESLKNFLNNFV